MKRISYIIPHFESLATLERLVQSIDTKVGDEIIIIDDCSCKETWNTLNEIFQDNNSVRIYQLAENKGAGAARNLGIAVSRNDWLIFADSDDYFVSEARGIIEKHIESNADVIYFIPTSTKESNNLSIRGNRHWYYEYLISNHIMYRNRETEIMMKYLVVVPWSKMIRRELVVSNDIRYDEVKVSNDVMFSTKVGFYSKEIIASKDTIYCCVENETSLTSDVSFEKMMIRLTVYAEQYNFLKNNLSKQEFKKMNLTGTSILLQGIKYKYSIKQLFKMIKSMIDNDIPLVTISWIKQTVIREIKLKSYNGG